MTPQCQVCDGPLSPPLLDLGYQPLCNQLITSPEQPQVHYPLVVHRCEPCDLVQLGYVLPTERVFGDQFAYLTGSSQGAVKYFDALAKRLMASTGARAGEAVVDIGSGDGTFLRPFQAAGCEVLGVEGAELPADLARKAGIPTVPYFLRKGVAERVVDRLQHPIRLITAMNVLAHTDHINDVCAEIRSLMNEGTTLVVQNHWLRDLLVKSSFDTIYHEHLRYFSLASLTKLLRRHDIYVYHAEPTDYYGGSFVAYATNHSLPMTIPAGKMVLDEGELHPTLSWHIQKGVILTRRHDIVTELTLARLEGKRVLGIGAPMKATTLLNVYGIGRELIECVAETNALKVGKAIPGVGIPIVDEDTLDVSEFQVAVVLSWNWADAIMAKYRARGFTGKFVIPGPRVRIVE